MLAQKFLEIYNKIGIIKPNNHFKILWDLVHLVLILYYFSFIPLLICFDQVYFSTLLYTISIIIFFMDIVLKFKTGYYYLGEVIYSSDKIFK